MVFSLPLEKVGGEHGGKASRNRSDGMILAIQMKQKIEQKAMAQRANDEPITLASRLSELMMKAYSQDKAGREISKDQVMPKRRHFDVGLIEAIDRPPDLMMRTVILPQEQDSVVSTKLENNSLGIIVNRHIWTSEDPVAAREAYNPPNDNLRGMSSDNAVILIKNRNARREDDTLAMDEFESYEGTIDESSSYNSMEDERPRIEVDEDWITRPVSREPFSCLCCMPGEF